MEPTALNVNCKYTDYFHYLEDFKNLIYPPTLDSLSLEEKERRKQPFWVTIPVMRFREKNERGVVINQYPAPTLGMLRFQVYSSLSFGAQGIIYWGLSDSASLNKKNCIIEAVSNPIKVEKNTSTQDLEIVSSGIYEVLKKFNIELATWIHVFSDSILHKIAHVGKSYANQPLVTSLGCIRNIRVGNAGVLMSWFTKEFNDLNNNHIKRKYIVIVNQDPFTEQSMTLTLDPSAEAKFITQLPPPIVEEETHLDIKSNNIIITKILSPGGIEAIYWDVRKFEP